MTEAFKMGDPFVFAVDAQRRRQQTPRTGRLGHLPLAAYVQAKRLERWSPEQIAHRLPLDFPDDPPCGSATRPSPIGLRLTGQRAESGLGVSGSTVAATARAMGAARAPPASKAASA